MKVGNSFITVGGMPDLHINRLFVNAYTLRISPERTGSAGAPNCIEAEPLPRWLDRAVRSTGASKVGMRSYL